MNLFIWVPSLIIVVLYSAMLGVLKLPNVKKIFEGDKDNNELIQDTNLHLTEFWGPFALAVISLFLLATNYFVDQSSMARIHVLLGFLMLVLSSHLLLTNLPRLKKVLPFGPLNEQKTKEYLSFAVALCAVAFVLSMYMLSTTLKF